ncbi:MAG: hypothetical protein Q9173_004374 [Seirophora scorigena]
MQSQWIPLFTSTLSLEPSEDEIDHYEVVASLTNIDNEIYIASRFLLPSAAPEHPLSRYSTSWDEFDREYKVSLRQPVPRVLFPLFPTYAIVEAADGACLPHDGSSLVDDTLNSPATNQPDTPTSIKTEICLPTFVPADDIDLPESPVKAHLLERPGAPTPGRGRTQYVSNDDSDEEEDYPNLAVEDPGMDDVFGDGEASHTCNDPCVLQPLERVTPALSLATIHSIVPGFINGPDNMTTRPNSAQQESVTDSEASTPAQQTLDIDFDEVFGENPNEIQEDEEDIVMSHASDLLARRAQGLKLSEFVPTGHEAINALHTAFQCKGFAYNFEGAKLAASDIAYIGFSLGLTTLKKDGLATRQFLTGVEGVIAKSDTVKEDPSKLQATTTFDHYNFFGEPVETPSSTPASVSLFIQMSAGRKPSYIELCRQGVLLSQANRYVDPVTYRGSLSFTDLQEIRGAAFQDRVIGDVYKATNPQGWFGNPNEGDSIIMDTEEICEYYLIQGWQPEMQRPYYLENLDLYHGDSQGWSIVPRGFQETYQKRIANGFIVKWSTIEERPDNVRSKLWMAQSAEDDDLEVELAHPFHEVEDLNEPTEPLVLEDSGDSSSEADSDEEKQQLSRPDTPPSPVSQVADHFPTSFDNTHSSALSYSKIAFVDTPLCAPEPKRLEGATKTTTTINFDSIYSPALSFSKVIPSIDAPPCVSGATEPKPEHQLAATSKCDEQPPIQLNPPTTNTTNPSLTPRADRTTEEGEAGLSRYAFGYGILMFTIGIVLSMW